MEIKLPKYLYKYRKWDKEKEKEKDKEKGYDHRILTDSEIYFTSARKFNDPFDCRIPMRYDLCPEEQMKSRMRDRLKNDNPNMLENEIENNVNHFYDKKLWLDPENVKRTEEMKFTDYGLFSLTEIDDDILMWSHYANSHKGFCVGIDTEKFEEYLRMMFSAYNILIDLIKIIYSVPYPILNPLELDDEEYFKSLLKYKAAHWSYEKEYRYIIFNKSDCPLKIDRGIINKVILGCEMPEEHKNEIKKIIKEMNTKVTLYQAVKKKDEFGLDIEEINI